MSKRFTESEVLAMTRNKKEEKALKLRLQTLLEQKGAYNDNSLKEQKQLVAICKDSRRTSGYSPLPKSDRANSASVPSLQAMRRYTKPWAMTTQTTTFNINYRDDTSLTNNSLPWKRNSLRQSNTAVSRVSTRNSSKLLPSRDDCIVKDDTKDTLLNGLSKEEYNRTNNQVETNENLNNTENHADLLNKLRIRHDEKKTDLDHRNNNDEESGNTDDLNNNLLYDDNEKPEEQVRNCDIPCITRMAIEMQSKDQQNGLANTDESTNAVSFTDIRKLYEEETRIEFASRQRLMRPLPFDFGKSSIQNSLYMKQRVLDNAKVKFRVGRNNNRQIGLSLNEDDLQIGENRRSSHDIMGETSQNQTVSVQIQELPSSEIGVKSMNTEERSGNGLRQTPESGNNRLRRSSSVLHDANLSAVAESHVQNDTADQVLPPILTENDKSETKLHPISRRPITSVGEKTLSKNGYTKLGQKNMRSPNDVHQRPNTVTGTEVYADRELDYSSDGSEEVDYIIYKGKKIRNYIKPQSRYKSDPFQFRRREKLVRKLATETEIFVDDNRKRLYKVDITFSKATRQRLLKQLVDENSSKESKSKLDIRDDKLDFKIKNFLKSIDNFCNTSVH